MKYYTIITRNELNVLYIWKNGWILPSIKMEIAIVSDYNSNIIYVDKTHKYKISDHIFTNTYLRIYIKILKWMCYLMQVHVPDSQWSQTNQNIGVRSRERFIAGPCKENGGLCSKTLNSAMFWGERFWKARFVVKASGCVNCFWLIGGEVTGDAPGNLWSARSYPPPGWRP